MSDPTQMSRPSVPDRETFDKCHLSVMPGDHYGFEFPISVAMLRDWGEAFLTKAFHASGVLSPDNCVREILAIEPVEVQGASERALITVAYAKDEPGLHHELFAKFAPVDADFKYSLARLGSGEVVMQRLSREGRLPVTTAKYYFGDHSAATTNYFLITERIAFGAAPIEPAHRKGYDHEIAELEAHYELLARSLARLVAAHKRGDLGSDIDRLFPFGAAGRDFDPIDDAPARIDRLVTFVSQTAPQLFISEATDPAFLERWRDDLLFGLEHKDVINAYLHRDRDYTGLCHPNLNVDNAWYWRNPEGNLAVGLLDWGGAGQMSVAQALSGMMMMPEPEKYRGLVDLVHAVFVQELSVRCGVTLDPQELRLQHKASLYSTAICTIVSIIVDYLEMVPKEAWGSMRDRFDPMLVDSGLIAAVIWVDNMLREWRDELTPGDACRQIVARSASDTAPAPAAQNIADQA